MPRGKEDLELESASICSRYLYKTSNHEYLSEEELIMAINGLNAIYRSFLYKHAKLLLLKALVTSLVLYDEG